MQAISSVVRRSLRSAASYVGPTSRPGAGNSPALGSPSAAVAARQHPPLASEMSTSSSTSSPPPPRRGRLSRNAALEAVKKAGLAKLEQTAQDVAAKTRDPLLVSEESGRPSVRQLREAARIQRLLDEAIESFSRKDSTFCVRGEPIEIIEVEVSPDIRHARAYWTLPFSLLTLPDKVRNGVKERMQAILDSRGSRLQVLVHARLSFYYPPRIRFVPADDDLISHAFKELDQDY